MKRYIHASTTIQITSSNYTTMKSIMAEIYHNQGADPHLSKQEIVKTFINNVLQELPDIDLSTADIRKIGSQLYDMYF